MGHCCSKGVTVSADKDDVVSTSAAANNHRPQRSAPQTPTAASNGAAARTPAHSFTTSPFQSPYPPGIAPTPSPARTPGRKFRWPLPPPSPAKPIMSAFMKRQPAKPTPERITETSGEGGERQLDKSFGYSKNIAARFELGKEVGRGHFGHTCWAKGKKGELKNQQVAVKIISKAKVMELSVFEFC